MTHGVPHKLLLYFQAVRSILGLLRILALLAVEPSLLCTVPAVPDQRFRRRNGGLLRGAAFAGGDGVA